MGNETVYRVMNHVDGMTLKEMVMKSGKLTYEKLCRYLCPVMKDLSKIHEKGIIHGAICPDNIMVNADGEVHLLDLGVAKDLYETKETQKEDSGKIRRYLSPLKETQKEDLGKAQAKNAPQSTMVLRNGFRALEQYQTNGEIGPWTDVYAMTATMYYLLSGKDLPTPMDRLDSEKEKTVQNVINSLEITEKTKEGMRKGLAILKKDRIGTMRELLEYCSEEPVPTAAFPSKRRRKWPIFLLGAVVIAGGAYAAKVGFHSTKSAEQYYEEGNYEKALAAYREAGDTENVKRVLQAAYDRAEDYSQGNNGYEKNEEEAIRYYKLVAESDGDINETFVNVSSYNLGRIMAYNETKEDDTEAASWLEKTASKSDIVANYAAVLLGDMYANGQLGEPDYSKAIELYKQAANNEYGFAMLRLGRTYENGWYDTEINLEEALKWYQLAADQDYDGAQECVDRVEAALQNAAEDS